ncbi:MAG: fumarylacetoacetate hydrolase family protein [Archangium sp.]|nr:fumarylacetoacetate hydrolase family protein [Archangium sp.]MDP3154060.1 fumarylacetoacetate hydrolase family protein [Archangium sp.]MDP3570037.1 fumarylacetoacetate hydrolase family protein [Archangium sp.]
MMASFARVEAQGRAVFVEVIDGRLFELSGAPWDPGTVRGAALSTEPSWLPVSPASKVVAIGQNYRKHAEEMGKSVPVEPLLFTKPSTALNGHGGNIVLPPASNEVHYEAELALVIGKKLKGATVDEARSAIFALTCFNDVTARDIQKREVQHTRGKGYDTFACCGPVMVTGLSPDDLRVQCRVNGVTKQDGRTSDMVHKSAELVSFISHVMTLLPGDLVSTGTPSGVGPLQAGDVVEVELEGVGVLRNHVVRG